MSPFGPWPGSGGGGGPTVSQIVAGSGISISPPGGTGIVTITNSQPGSMAAQPPINHLINGEFRLYQRQNPAVLTTRASVAGRAFGPDRWTVTTQNAAGWQVGQTVTAGTFVPGLPSPYISRWIPVAATQKCVIAQVEESQIADNMSGARSTFQIAARCPTAGPMTIRIGVLQLLAPGVVNVIPGTFVSAFNANGTDPTFGANLSLITPAAATGGTIVGNGVSCVLTSTFQTFSVSVSASGLALNLIPVIWTDSQVTTANELQIAAAGHFLSPAPLTWEIPDPTLELLRCQRYFWKTFRLDTSPAQGIGINTGEMNEQTSRGSAAVNVDGFSIRLPVNVFMGSVPITTTFSPTSVNAQARDVSANADCSATSGVVNTSVLDVSYTGNAATIVGNQIAVHATVEAEL